MLRHVNNRSLKMVLLLTTLNKNKISQACQPQEVELVGAATHFRGGEEEFRSDFRRAERRRKSSHEVGIFGRARLSSKGEGKWVKYLGGQAWSGTYCDKYVRTLEAYMGVFFIRSIIDWSLTDTGKYAGKMQKQTS